MTDTFVKTRKNTEIKRNKEKCGSPLNERARALVNILFRCRITVEFLPEIRWEGAGLKFIEQSYTLIYAE